MKAHKCYEGLLDTCEEGSLGHLVDPPAIDALAQVLEVGPHNGRPHLYIDVQIASKHLPACMHSLACTCLIAHVSLQA